MILALIEDVLWRAVFRKAVDILTLRLCPVLAKCGLDALVWSWVELYCPDDHRSFFGIFGDADLDGFGQRWWAKDEGRLRKEWTVERMSYFILTALSTILSRSQFIIVLRYLCFTIFLIVHIAG